MMRLALVVAVVLLSQAGLSPRRGSAQTSVTPPAPIVLVFDGTGSRVNGERVRRALAATLHRAVLRLGDDGAASAPAHLTVAFSPPDRWIVEFVRGEAHTTRTVILRTPTVARVTRVVATIVVDTEPPPPPTRTGPLAQRSDWISLVGDEILDPFAGRPPVTRSHPRRPYGSELVDPFGNPTSTWRSYDDVIDPWSR